jgi:hypothetical protein
VYADELLRPWFEVLREEFQDLSVFDCHTHVGINDPSGFSATLGELIESLELIDGRAAVFPLKEPRGYARANLELIDAAAGSGNRLVAFARLDPADAPAERAQEALDAGALGLKLHPSGEEFDLLDQRLDPVWAIAHAQRLPVVVHAGPELESAGPALLQIARQHPQARLIAAHGALPDLAWLWQEVTAVPNLFFDTSWWSATEVVTLLTLIPAGQILSASDLPYCTPLSGSLATVRCALQLGLSEQEIRLMLGEQFARLLAREDPIVTPARERTHAPVDPLLERAYVYLIAALEATQRGQEPEQMLTLARHCTNVPEDHPAFEVMQSVHELLELYEANAPTLPRKNTYAAGWDLIAAAALLARTPAAPVPAPVSGAVRA